MAADGDHWQGEEGIWLLAIKSGPDSLHIGALISGESALTRAIEVSTSLPDPTGCKPSVGNPRSDDEPDRCSTPRPKPSPRPSSRFQSSFVVFSGETVAGTRIENVEPFPNSLVTARSPPSIWQKRRDMARPKPVPP